MNYDLYTPELTISRKSKHDDKPPSINVLTSLNKHVLRVKNPTSGREIKHINTWGFTLA